MSGEEKQKKNGAAGKAGKRASADGNNTGKKAAKSKSEKRKESKSATNGKTEDAALEKAKKSSRVEIKGIILVAIGALLMAAFFIENSIGTFGATLKIITCVLLGLPGYFVPTAIIISGIMIILARQGRIFGLSLVYVVMLFVLASALIHTFYYVSSEYTNLSTDRILLKLYVDGISLRGGGILGGMTALPIISVFQVLGAQIVLSTLLLIDVILLTNISVVAILAAFGKTVSKGARKIRGVKKDRGDKKAGLSGEPDALEDAELFSDIADAGPVIGTDKERNTENRAARVGTSDSGGARVGTPDSGASKAEAPDSGASRGEASARRTARREASDRRVARGEAPDNRAGRGEAPDNRVAMGEARDSRTARGGTSDSRTARGGTSDSRAARGGTSDSRTFRNGVHDNRVGDEGLPETRAGNSGGAKNKRPFRFDILSLYDEDPGVVVNKKGVKANDDSGDNSGSGAGSNSGSGAGSNSGSGAGSSSGNGVGRSSRSGAGSGFGSGAGRSSRSSAGGNSADDSAGDFGFWGDSNKNNYEDDGPGLVIKKRPVRGKISDFNMQHTLTGRMAASARQNRRSAKLRELDEYNATGKRDFDVMFEKAKAPKRDGGTPIRMNSDPGARVRMNSDPGARVRINSDPGVKVKTRASHAKALYRYPKFSLLEENKDSMKGYNKMLIQANETAVLLEEALQSFKVKARVVNISMGPSVTRYDMQPDTGVKVNTIMNLANDISLKLASSGVRIAPVADRSAVGIEVPNKVVLKVMLREILESEMFKNAKSKLAFAVGKDITGNTVVADIANMPHMLVAGATGSGKSVCINCLIMSLLFKSSPDDVKLIMIDPKVVELDVYNGIPHLMIPVVTEPKKAAGALAWAVQEMLTRYKAFSEIKVRDLNGYNNFALRAGGRGSAGFGAADRGRGEDGDGSRSDGGSRGRGEGNGRDRGGGGGIDKMPRLVIIIDELADLMMAAPKDVEDSICRLAQMGRAAGIHLVIATQRPSVDVITGVIKANIPSRIACAVASQIDSRTILDMAGAEKLLGRGDMLFNPVGQKKPLRVQGAFVSDEEVESVVNYVKSVRKAKYDSDIIEEITSASAASEEPSGGDNDELLPRAIEIVIDAGQASVSMLQRRLSVGYARAARIVDQMETRGIVSGFDGSKPRQILISKQQFYEMKF